MTSLISAEPRHKNHSMHLMLVSLLSLSTLMFSPARSFAAGGSSNLLRRSLISADTFRFQPSNTRLFTTRGGANQNDDSFPTWTFKDPCKTMDVNDFPSTTISFVNSASSSSNSLKVSLVYGAEEESDTPFSLPDDTDDAIKGIFNVHSEDFKNGTAAGEKKTVSERTRRGCSRFLAFVALAQTDHSILY